MYTSFIQAIAVISFVSSAKATSLPLEKQVNVADAQHRATVESREGSPVHRRDLGGREIMTIGH
eukprot:Awhi_evm2s14670